MNKEKKLKAYKALFDMIGDFPGYSGKTHKIISIDFVPGYRNRFIIALVTQREADIFSLEVFDTIKKRLIVHTTTNIEEKLKIPKYIEKYLKNSRDTLPLHILNEVINEG